MKFPNGGDPLTVALDFLVLPSERSGVGKAGGSSTTLLRPEKRSEEQGATEGLGRPDGARQEGLAKQTWQGLTRQGENGVCAALVDVAGEGAALVLNHWSCKFRRVWRRGTRPISTTPTTWPWIP
jgi:hypothetical protein